MITKAGEITKNALRLGWDEEFGGILHYCTDDKSKLKSDAIPPENEPIYFQVLNGCDDKLWWPHSEALYATLLFYNITNDKDFLLWYNTIKEYTFKTFPNDNKVVREWVQIRKRNGSFEEKVVALPVKAPYHITRNFMLIIEMLNNN